MKITKRLCPVLVVVPVALMVVGCEPKGTCIQKVQDQTLCAVAMQKSGCTVPGWTFTAEDSTAGISRCKSLGLTRAVGLNGGSLKDDEIDKQLGKDMTVVFAKP